MDICKEMQQLRELLDEKGIEWEDHSETYEGTAIDMWICRTWFEYKGNKVSVINGFGTYGGYDGLDSKANLGRLEMMDGATEPIGFLMADDIFSILDEKISEDEMFFLNTLRFIDNPEAIAFILQEYIQENGPLSNELGDKIKRYLVELKEKEAEEEDKPLFCQIFDPNC